MSKGFCFLVVLAATLSLVAATPPSPTLAYECSPDYRNRDNYVPTAPPLVYSSTTAFVCYAELYTEGAYCQMVSPANQAFSAPRVTLNTSLVDSFDQQPLALTLDSALYTTNSPTGSYWAASSETAVYPAGKPMSRFGSTARADTDPSNYTAFIPFGVHPGLDQGTDILGSFSLLNLTNPTHNYFLSWNHSSTADGKSLLHDVLHYRGQLMFMHNNTFYQYNASTGVKIRSVNDPCKVGSGFDGMNLARGTFGSDRNGDLDAFIVYGNTTSVHPSFVVCRISHNTGLMSWNVTLAEDYVVQDVTGGAGLLFLSGKSSTSGAGFHTMAIDAMTGTYYGFIARSFQDYQSYPTIVPAGVMQAFAPGCGPALVLQQHTNISAFCINPMIANRSFTPVWVNTDYLCTFRPLFDPLTSQLVCVSSGSYVVSLWADSGVAVWLDNTRQIATLPQLMTELGVSYAFMMDLDATLYGYQIALVAPTTTTAAPPPSTPQPTQGGDAPAAGGLSGGAAAGIAICVIGVVTAAAVLIFLQVRKAKRRSAYTNQNTALNTEYGGIS